MSSKRITFVLGLAALALLPLAGCRQHQTSETYYLISNNLKLPYWQTVNSGFTKAGVEYGVHVQLAGPDTYDPNAELAAFRKAVAAHAAGILVSVADASLFRSDINDAVQAGVPVITVDSDAPTSQRLYFIGTDNLAAGHLGAERLVDKLKGKGNVVFYSIPGQPNIEERMHGYRDVLSDHPGIKVVTVFDVKGDPSIAFDQTRSLLDRKGAEKVDAFVSLESSSGPAIAEVLARANVSDRTIIGMDVGPEMLKLINAGAVDASVSQKPWTMGYAGLKALDEINHHKPDPFQNNYGVDSFSRYPTFVNTGAALVTKDNVGIYIDSETKAQSK